MPQLDAPFIYLVDLTPTKAVIAINSVLTGNQYRIYRSATPDFATQVQLWQGAGDSLVTDNGITAGTPRYYRAMSLAWDGKDDSEYSPIIAANPPNPNALNTPPFYFISKKHNYVEFAIIPVVFGVNYKIERSTTSNFSSTSLAYYGLPGVVRDNAVVAGETYYYRVNAVGNTGLLDSAYSQSIMVVVPDINDLDIPELSPLLVTPFRIEFEVSEVDNAYSYTLQRDITEDFENPVEVSVIDGKATDFDLSPSTNYHYRVKANPLPDTEYSDSDWSEVITITTESYLALPTPSLIPTAGAVLIALTIVGVLGGESYTIQRDVNSSFTDPIVIYNGTQLSYNDTPLIPNTTYYYRVRANATDSNAASLWSSVISVTTGNYTPPVPPDNPIPGLKYFMDFVDVNGFSVDVRFYFKDFMGTPLRLTGSPEPVTISYSGFDGDIYEADKLITDAKYTVNLINPGFSDSFYEDITNIHDGDVWVRIQRSSDATIFSGWLIPDEFSRTFDRTLYEVSLTIASPFSIMKTRELLEADGKMMFGSKSIADIVNACIRSSIHPSLAQRYEILSTLKEQEYVGTLDLFNQLRFFIESVNDDNGRPPKCYDILNKICNSFGFLLYWINDRFTFIHIYDSLQPSKAVKIKESGVFDFFTGNTENITRVRGSKEVSVKFDYGRQIGLLPDGRFLQATEGSLNFWYYFDLRDENNNVISSINPSTVVRKGNGRKANPYRMRFLGEIPLEGRRMFLQSESWYQGLTVQTPRLRTNDLVTIAINFKYFDWRRKYNREQANQIDEKVPYLYVMVLAIPPNDDWRGVQFWADMKNIEGTNIDIIESSNPFPFWFPNLPISGAVTPIAIAIESNTNIQKFESTLKWKFPQGWNMQISILGMRWDEGKPVAISSSDLWIDVLDVIVSKQTDAEGYNSTGEEVYLAQLINSAQIDETRDVFLGNFNNADISGALLKGDNTISKGVARGGTGDKLQNWLVRMIMAQKRTPRYKIDFDFKSSLVRPFDLLILQEGDNDLLPNKYAIGRYEYNMKSAETKVTCIEINTEDREYKPGGDPTDTEGDYIEEPTSDFDMLETYKTYN